MKSYVTITFTIPTKETTDPKMPVTRETGSHPSELPHLSHLQHGGREGG